MKKVPLVVYKDGERIVIGEAAVDSFAEGYIGVVAEITNPKYTHILDDKYASFSIGPMGEGIEMASIPMPDNTPVREGYLAEYYRKNPPKTD